MENRADATVGRTACLGALAVLSGTAKFLFHGCNKRMDKGSGTQSQLIVNSADIIVHTIGCGNVVSAGWAQFGRQMRVCVFGNGGDIIGHRRDQRIIAHGWNGDQVTLKQQNQHWCGPS